jgi:hypothetical protein
MMELVIKFQAYLDHKVHKVTDQEQDLKAHKAIKALWEFKETKVQQELTVLKGSRDFKG